MKYIILLIALPLFGCAAPQTPIKSLREAKVADGPLLISREAGVFLRYRRNLDPERVNLMLAISYKNDGSSGYYFFTGAGSSFYYGNQIEYPLAYDEGATELARNGRIYWLDPDGSTRKIPFQKAPR
jgi:hypothetical protein